MSIIIEPNENSRINQKIVRKTPQLKWGWMMGRPICGGASFGTDEGMGCGWSAIKDWPDGGGYIDHTPWLVFKNHVKEKHGIDVNVFIED